jgi:hypothetical protein
MIAEARQTYQTTMNTLLDRFSAEHLFHYVAPVLNNSTPLVSFSPSSVPLCAICSLIERYEHHTPNMFVLYVKYCNLVIFLPIVLNVHPLSIKMHSIEGSSIQRGELCYDRFLYHALYACFLSFFLCFFLVVLQIHARYAWTIVSSTHGRHMLVAQTITITINTSSVLLYFFSSFLLESYSAFISLLELSIC